MIGLGSELLIKTSLIMKKNKLSRIGIVVSSDIVGTKV